MTGAPVAQVIAFGLTGLALGAAQLLSLRSIVRRYVAGRSHARVVILHAARMALIVSAWVVLARFGGARCLLAAFIGFLVARSLVLAATRRVGS
jgi:hypothetical protein